VIKAFILPSCLAKCLQKCPRGRQDFYLASFWCLIKNLRDRYVCASISNSWSSKFLLWQSFSSWTINK